MPFRDIVGNQRIRALLSRALEQGTLPPSLLMAGPSGIGKRRVALALAEALNCLQPRTDPVDACGECVSCRKIARGTHPDIVVVEPGDSGAIKIDQIRDVIDRASYRPFEARRRLVIADDADAMLDAAQNALLKTLEEPPPASVFVLVSAMPDLLLPTVRSRCPRLRFAPLTEAEVAAVLMRDHGYAESDARAAAAESDGSLGRALEAQSSDLSTARSVAQRVLAQVARVADPQRRLEVVKELTSATGSPAGDRNQLGARLRAMSSLVRDLGVLGVQGDRGTLANADLHDELSRLSSSYDCQRSMRAFQAIDTALAALERNASPKIVANWLALEI
jgi:DNA polymerase-3 subunit delta'